MDLGAASDLCEVLLCHFFNHQFDCISSINGVFQDYLTKYQCSGYQVAYSTFQWPHQCLNVHLHQSYSGFHQVMIVNWSVMLVECSSCRVIAFGP